MKLKSQHFSWLFPVAVIATLQAPKAMHAYSQGTRAGSLLCIKIENGYTPYAAVKSASSEMEGEKYSKTWEGLVESGMKNRLKKCTALKAEIKNRIFE